MSNNTRRPPSGGTYNNGRGRRPVAAQTRTPAPPPPQKQSSAPEIQDQYMWLLFCGWIVAALFMLFLGRPFHAFQMWVVGVFLAPLLEKIIRKESRYVDTLVVRLLINRVVRLVIACVVSFFVGIAFIFSLAQTDGDNVINHSEANIPPSPSVTVANSPAASPTATPIATPTPTATQTPDVTQDPTETPEPTDRPTATPKPTVKPTEKATKAPKPTEEPEGEMVWISGSGSRYHADPNCSNMSSPSQISKNDAEARGRKPCKTCYLR